MSINTQQLISSFSEFATAKNVDKPTLIRMLDDVIKKLIIKQFGTASNFHIIINPAKGDLQIWRHREIVADDSEEINQSDKISLSDAQKIQDDFEIGEEVAEEISLDIFTRRAVKKAEALLMQKIQDVGQVELYKQYKKLEGEIISAEAYYISRAHILLYDDKKNELTLPNKELIPGETFRKSQYIRAVIHKVYIHKNKVTIILSRTSPKFLERLLESEIPEISDKLVIIKKIVRQPGIKAKIAVISYDDRIDPVGACVGIKGVRIRNIMHEISNEQIDIINYTENLEIYLSRALGLKPGMITKIHNTEDTIILDFKPGNIALAIGRKGYNISLASQLMGKDIKVNDIYIEEFADVIPKTTIGTLKLCKLNTAKMVLALTTEELVQKTKLDEQTIQNLCNILNKSIEEKNL